MFLALAEHGIIDELSRKTKAMAMIYLKILLLRIYRSWELIFACLY